MAVQVSSGSVAQLASANEKLTKQIEDLTDVYSFLFWQLGMN